MEGMVKSACVENSFPRTDADFFFKWLRNDDLQINYKSTYLSIKPNKEILNEYYQN